MNWLKHAFAVDRDRSVEPTDAQRAVVSRVCRAIVRRRLTTPALLFLEMVRPLNYLTAQTMHFFAPIVTAVVDRQGYECFAAFLECRGSVEYLCRQLEAMEAEQDAADRS